MTFNAIRCLPPGTGPGSHTASTPITWLNVSSRGGAAALHGLVAWCLAQISHLKALAAWIASGDAFASLRILTSLSGAGWPIGHCGHVERAVQR